MPRGTERWTRAAHRGGRGARGGPGGGFGGRGGGQPPDALYQYEVYCLDRTTGNVIWKQLATERKPTIPTHRTNTYASDTPVTDGQRVYAYFGMTGVFCYDLDGQLIWTKDLGSYPMAMGWGTGSSPVLADNCLILQCDNEKASFLVALDKATGEEKWRATPRRQVELVDPLPMAQQGPHRVGDRVRPACH